ncbi:MAG: hypothetical protein WDN25_28415 [Acetobacteraceae bacterium]
MAFRSLLLILLGLSGCGQNSQWIKEGTSIQDYNSDSYACERDARQSGYFGGGLVGALNMQSFFNKCMVAHGWRLANAASVSSPPIPGFTQQQWETGRTQCRVEANKAVEGGQLFADSFHHCMTRMGL